MSDEAGSEIEIPLAPFLSFGRAVEEIRAYAVIVLTSDGTQATWNRGVEQIFGYTREEFVGRPGSMIFVPEDVEEGVPEGEMSRAARDGVAGDNRWHLKKDGSRFWANGVLSAIRAEDGEILAFVKVLRDNTAQKEAEDALQRAHAELERRVEERTAELQATVAELRRSEQSFAAIFRAGPFAAALIDGKTGRFIDVNDAFCRLSGYDQREVGELAVGELAGRFAAPEAGDAAGPEVLGGFRDEEIELRTKGGDVRAVLASEVRVLLDGSGARLVMFYDITERKRGEEELMQAIQDVMQDASWFSRSVVERLAEIRSGSADHARIGELTRRERQVLEHLARGRSNAEIARELGIAAQTVRNYITSVYEKIGVKSRVEAVVWARERGLGI